MKAPMYQAMDPRVRLRPRPLPLALALWAVAAVAATFAGCGDSAPAVAFEQSGIGIDGSAPTIGPDVPAPFDASAGQLDIDGGPEDADGQGAPDGSAPGDAGDAGDAELPPDVEGCGEADPCETDSDCADPLGDLAACFAFACLDGCCAVVSTEGLDCDDGDSCTLSDTCGAAGCEGGEALVCDDGDACTEDSCDPALGCQFIKLAPEALCDDGNPCTTDTCTALDGCVSTPNEAPCDDGDACTESDACSDGLCAGAVPVGCEGGGPCLVAACDPAVGCTLTPLDDGAICEDGFPCTQGDACLAGACVAGANVCDCVTAEDCPAGLGGPCVGDVVCTDAGVCELDLGAVPVCAGTLGPCAEEVCDPTAGGLGACVTVTAAGGTPCATGQACDGPGQCKDGGCAAQPLVCDDGNPCTADACDPVTGACGFTATPGGLCDDGDPCTFDEACVAGVCTPFGQDPCDDGDPCTVDSCAPGLGCQHAPGGCDDGDPCTVDACGADGECVSFAKGCDDGDPCTADACDAETGECVAAVVEDGTACDDGDACTADEACVSGLCEGGAPVCECDSDDDCQGLVSPCAGSATCQALEGATGTVCVVDPSTAPACAGPLGPCLAEVCDPDTGACVLAEEPEGQPCEDGDACAVDTVCANGSCAGAAVDCDDGEPCTVDSCDSSLGCVNAPDDGAPCDDGDVCTEGDACAAGTCVSGAPVACDDGDACVEVACVSASGLGCVATPVGCDDGDPCTVDGCDPVGGCASAPVKCPPGDGPCEVGVCEAATGACVLQWLAQGSACDDGDPCTEGDTCDAGQCVPGVSVCDCAQDADCLEGWNKCLGTPACDQETNLCVAVAGTAPACGGEAGPCSEELCDPASGGCLEVPFDDGTACDDADACTGGDQCVAGACVGEPKVCDDGEGCTSDTCVEGVCLTAPAAGPCDDGDACTASDACEGGACVGAAVVCDDGDACTADTCDDALGCVATPIVCEDGDLCTTDGCDVQSGCTFKAKACEDASGVCETTVCDPQSGACTVVAVGDGKICSDGDPCTVGDGCVAGACAAGEGTKPCGDGDACTADICVSGSGCVNDAVVCDDGDPCTTDGCDPDSGCTAAPVICPAVVGDPCVVGVCDGSTGACGLADALDGTPCDDGDDCTAGDQCQGGACTGPSFICDCQTDADCLDGFDACLGVPSCDLDTFTCVPDADTAVQCAGALDDCTSEVCDSVTGGCVVVPQSDGTACDDAGACFQAGVCSGGACAASPVACPDDGDVCTEHVCDADSGECGTSPLTGPFCDDGDPCTTLDRCQAGVCVGTLPDDCDDGDPCTDDVCAAGAGCQNTATVCDDGSACTIDTCDPDVGCVTESVVCPDPSGPCLVAVCNHSEGCDEAPKLDGVACDDGDACTSSDACVDGVCGGTAKACDDGDVCTVDSCDGATGDCEFAVTLGAPCDDGQACTESDQCDASGTCEGKAKICDDADPCTADSCDVATGGCVTSPISGTSCDDGDACTEGDVCTNGACAGQAKTCDDGDVCTADICQAGACLTAPLSGVTCDDGDPCTTGDSCHDGGCDGAPVDCDDGNPCTADACDGGACSYGAALDQPCDDGDPCTTDDACTSAGCEGSPAVCDDGDACTADACGAGGACVFVPIPGCSDPQCDGVSAGTPCDDGDGGTVADLCLLGKCAGFTRTNHDAADTNFFTDLFFDRVTHADGQWWHAFEIDPAFSAASYGLAATPSAGSIAVDEGTLMSTPFNGLHSGYALNADGTLWELDGSSWIDDGDYGEALEDSGLGEGVALHVHTPDSGDDKLWAVGEAGGAPYVRRCRVDDGEVVCDAQSLQGTSPQGLPRAISGQPNCAAPPCANPLLVLAADGEAGGGDYYNDVYENSNGNQGSWPFGFFDSGESSQRSNDVVVYGDAEALVVGGAGLMRYRSSDGGWSFELSSIKGGMGDRTFTGVWAGAGVLAVSAWRPAGFGQRALEVWTCPIDADPQSGDNWTIHGLGTFLGGSTSLRDIWGLDGGTLRAVGGYFKPGNFTGPHSGVIFERQP